MSLPEERLESLKEWLRPFKVDTVVMVRQFLSLLGIMAAMIEVVKHCRLHMRPIQIYLMAFWKPSSRKLEAQDSSQRAPDPTLGMVEESGKCDARVAFEKRQTSSDHHKSCILHPRMEGHAGSRQVGLEREVSIFKYAGDGSCYQNMQTFQRGL